jgi:hypothetical protein
MLVCLVFFEISYPVDDASPFERRQKGFVFRLPCFWPNPIRSRRTASLVHLRNHLERLLPPFLDVRLDRCVAHFAVQAQVLSLRDDHSHDLEVVRRAGLSNHRDRLNAMLSPVAV